MVLIERKAVLRYVSAYCTVSTKTVCVQAGVLPIEIVANEGKRVYSATCWVRQGVEKNCGSGVTQGMSHSINNGKNGSLETQKESGSICQYTNLMHGWKENMDRWIFT